MSVLTSVNGAEQRKIMADPRFVHFNNFIEALINGGAPLTSSNVAPPPK